MSAAAIRVGDYAGAVWRWWRRELSSMAPAGRKVRLVLSAEPDGRYRLLTETLRGARVVRRKEQRSGAQDLADWVPVLASRLKALPKAALGLRLAADACLCRTITVPWTAARRLRDILGLELERVTPFRRSEVYFDHVATDRPSRDGTVTAEQIILERSRIDPAIAELRDRGIAVSFVDCWDAAGLAARPVNLLGPQASQAGRVQTAGVLLTVALAFGVAAMAGAVALQQVDRYQRMLASIDTQLQANRREIATLRKAREARDTGSAQVASLLARRQAQVAKVHIIEQLSRQLPDDSWLTSLRIDGNVADLTGFSRSAAGLATTLAAPAKTGIDSIQKITLSGVRLTAPITFDTSRNREQFSLRLTVDDASPVPHSQVTHNLVLPAAVPVLE